MAYDPDDDDDDDDMDTATEPCASCGAEVYEDAERCPVCGEYLTRSLTAWRGKPWVWVLLGLLGIAAVIYTITYFCM